MTRTSSRKRLELRRNASSRTTLLALPYLLKKLMISSAKRRLISTLRTN